MSAQNPTSPLTVVEAYLAALNAHDIDRAASLLAEDVAMRFVGMDVAMTKAQILQALGWDIGTNGRFDYSVEAQSGDTVTINLTETNEFLELLGLPPLEARMTFKVSGDLIQAITYEPTGTASADPGTVQKALAAAIAWARQHRSGELDAIYPDGRLHYTQENGTRWVRLLREWRDATD